nr:CHASE3 domain-containing protein [Micromonospora sp. DSM 115978]
MDRSGQPSSGWTTQRWLTVGVALAMTVLAVLGAIGASVLAHTTSVNRALVGRSFPASVAALQLEAALVNQETGVRGYSLTGNSEFVNPYTLGIEQEREALATLRPLVAGDERLQGGLDRVVAAATAWRASYAVPVVEAPPGAPVQAATADVQAGRESFDLVRRTLTDQQRDLDSARQRASADLVGARKLRNWTFATIAAVLVALAGLVFVGLRRGVNRPLVRLSDDAHLVAAGDFDRPITATGPAD